MTLQSLLLEAVFNLWGQPVCGLELVAFASGIAAVWLTYRMHVANWPLGILSVTCYGWLFLQARLYADAVLQIAFVVLGIYGWIAWAGGKDAPGARIKVTHLPQHETVWLSVLTPAAILLVAWLLHRHTDSPAPLLDASIFALSLAATYAQARARLESWWLWIAVDMISIPLYWNRHLPLTAALYVLFLLICIRGLAAWRRQLAPGVPA